MDEKITRATKLEYEVFTDAILVRCWYGLWREGAPAEHQAMLEGMTWLDIGKALDGVFAIWEIERNHFRALRGRIDRIDFGLGPQGWSVREYPYGWVAGTPALRTVLKDKSFNYYLAIENCRQAGWTVHEWPATCLNMRGARAWRGKPLPIRSKGSIIDLRRRVMANMAFPHVGQLINYDFAFDL